MFALKRFGVKPFGLERLQDRKMASLAHRRLTIRICDGDVYSFGNACRPKLPHFDTAVISQAKVVDYLLNPLHPEGASKARFFLSAGFEPSRWEEMAAAFRALASKSDVACEMDSIHGRKYIVGGDLYMPTGGAARIRTVWIADGSDPIPRLVTAYPIGEKESE